jgi:hypothetical protein
VYEICVDGRSFKLLEEDDQVAGVKVLICRGGVRALSVCGSHVSVRDRKVAYEVIWIVTSDNSRLIPVTL